MFTHTVSTPGTFYRGRGEGEGKGGIKRGVEETIETDSEGAHMLGSVSPVKPSAPSQSGEDSTGAIWP